MMLLRFRWLFLLGVASGWTVGDTEPTDIYGKDPSIVRWSAGSNTSSSHGLKGGITWAFDPDLCGRIMPLFPEETLWKGTYFFPDTFWAAAMPSILNCDHLKSKIRMAMRAWEAANSNIRFFEVSSKCDNEWVNPRSDTPPAMPPSMW